MTKSTEGWHGWDEYADFYDWENARTVGRRDIAFWRQFVRETRAPALELGCGTGRVLVPMARAVAGTAPVVGVDRSSNMLALATARIRRLPRTQRPSVARADIRALPFPDRSFGVVVAAYGILQSILTDGDLDRVLRETARVLERGGRFGIDLVPDLTSWAEYRREVRLRGRSGGATITLTETVRQDRRRRLTVFDEEFTRRRGRRVDHRRFALTFRTVSVDEMTRRLDAAGLDVERVAGDYAGAPWTTAAETWLLVARKH